MSIPKLAGIETEFAIVGEEPLSASSRVVQSYPWIDLGTDPAVASAEGPNPSVAAADGNDRMLPNGARWYVDHAHPEYSTPESLDPLNVVILDRAGAELARRCVELASRSPGQPPLRLYKNNSDHFGHSYGCHENYLMDAGTYAALFGRRREWITALLVPFLVSRIVFTGAGKVGAENGGVRVEYQLSQRADFFEEITGLQTTHRRPIVNLRDEPHADPTRFRRLHVIAGDANLCPYAGWLKVGTLQIVLRLLEDGALAGLDLSLAEPVLAMRQVSRDPDCHREVALADGRAHSAVQLQAEFLNRAQRYFNGRPPSAAEARVMQGWEETLDALRTEPASLLGKIDWVTKRRILGELAVHRQWRPDGPRAREADLQYHALDPGESLFAAIDAAGLVVYPPGWDAQAVILALAEPPTDSRAYLRGRCIRRYASEIVRADWEELVLPFGRVCLPDPAQPGRDAGTAILERIGTADDLLLALSQLYSGASTVARSTDEEPPHGAGTQAQRESDGSGARGDAGAPRPSGGAGAAGRH